MSETGGAARDGLRVEREHGVAELVLDRPPGNRVAFALQTRLLDAIAGLAHEASDPASSLRAVLLRAEGPDLSHGADLGDPELASRMVSGEKGRTWVAELGQRLVASWDAMPVPTVVAFRGRAIGAGACLVMAADFRVAAPGATIAFPEVDRGMHLSWGILPILVRELGAPLARRLAVVGTPIAIEDLPAGAVEPCPDEDPAAAGRALAHALAAKPPLAVRAIQDAIRRAAAGEPGAADHDARLFAETTGSEDFAEAIAAWGEKRAGRYRGR